MKQNTDAATDELAYEVREKRKRRGGAGATVLYLQPTMSPGDMDDEQRATYDSIDYIEDVPEDAEVGDVVAAADLVGEEDEEDETEADGDDTDPVDEAVEEAKETGERARIDSTTVPCDGSEGDECSTDRVTRYAAPGGEIEAERVHLH